jgi:hypothetical protein
MKKCLYGMLRYERARERERERARETGDVIGGGGVMRLGRDATRGGYRQPCRERER